MKEFPDVVNMGSGFQGIFGDDRLACVSVRRLKEMQESFAENLGIEHPTMAYFPMHDEESGLYMTGAGWQEGGTGDSYVGAVILFGTSVGNGGGVPGSMTDDAGCLLVSQ